MENYLNTNLLYLNDDSLYNINSKILDVVKLSEKEIKSLKSSLYKSQFDDIDINQNFYYVILEDTIFYPQSFGQDCDLGNINTHNSNFKVIYVKKTDKQIKHIGFFLTDDILQKNDIAIINIDKERRLLHSRIHTAGHLIDDAFLMLGYKIENDEATKACHKVMDSYVEFNIKNFYHDSTIFIQALENIINSQIKKNIPVKKIIVKNQELDKIVYKKYFIPTNIDKIRVVITNGVSGLMCGGTHVGNLCEIGKVKIDNLIFADNILKIQYSLV